MSDDLKQLAHRVAKLEAREAIRQLKYTYAAACDDGVAADVIVPMFTENGVWDGGERWGRHEGRDALMAFYGGASGTITFALHFMIGGDIHVDDSLTTATGTWQILEPVAIDGPEGKFSAVLAGYYKDKYELTDDGWKFSHVGLDWAMQARLDKGWATDRFTV
jgi:hypothetical protein